MTKVLLLSSASDDDLYYVTEYVISVQGEMIHLLFLPTCRSHQISLWLYIFIFETRDWIWLVWICDYVAPTGMCWLNMYWGIQSNSDSPEGLPMTSFSLLDTRVCFPYTLNFALCLYYIWSKILQVKVFIEKVRINVLTRLWDPLFIFSISWTPPHSVSHPSEGVLYTLSFCPIVPSSFCKGNYNWLCRLSCA